MRESADRKLAVRLIRGDKRSFDVYFNNYFPRIYRFALVRLDNDHSLAEDTAQNVRIQYGGSANPDNIGSFMRHPDIDGALVGGASLKPGFVEMVRATAQVVE